MGTSLEPISLRRQSPSQTAAKLGLEGLAELRAPLNPAQTHELEALSRESDDGLWQQELLTFAGRLEKNDQSEAAASLYSLLASQPGDSVQASAQSRLDALLGKGGFGGRAEVLLGRFANEATDPKVILPMVAGSVVYSLARTTTLGRLAGTATASWYSRGLGARFAAATVGFAAEVPTFALSSRALRHLGSSSGLSQEPGLSQELASAGITLGLMKAFAFAGNRAFETLHGFDALKTDIRWAELMPYSQFAISQGATFAGLLTAHRAEETLGLRAHIDGSTTVTDTLASMLSMGVGAHLGHRLLGERFLSWQRQLDLAAKQDTNDGIAFLSTRLPEQLAVASSGPQADSISKLGFGISLMSFEEPEGPGHASSGGQSSEPRSQTSDHEKAAALRQEIRRGDLSKLETLGELAHSSKKAAEFLAEFARAGHGRALGPLALAAQTNLEALSELGELSFPNHETPIAIAKGATDLLSEGRETFFPLLVQGGNVDVIYNVLLSKGTSELDEPLAMVGFRESPLSFSKHLPLAATLFLGGLELYSAVRGVSLGWWHVPSLLAALSGLKLSATLHRHFQNNSLTGVENLAYRFLHTGDLKVLHLFPWLVANGKASRMEAFTTLERTLEEFYGVSKENTIRKQAQEKSEFVISGLERGAKLVPALADPLRSLAGLGNIRAQEALERVETRLQKIDALRQRRSCIRGQGGPLLALGLGLGSLLYTERAESATLTHDRLSTTSAVHENHESNQQSPWWQYSPWLLLGMALSGKGKGDSDPPIDPSQRIRELKIELSAKDKSAKTRRKSLEELNRHLMVLEQNDPSLPEGARVLRELFNDPDDILAGAAMENYGTLILAGYQLSNTEIRTGHRLLNKIRNDVDLAEGRRKKAELGLAYIEGGMELNGTAKFQALEGTLPLTEEKPVWKFNLDRINEALLPLKLRKIFTDPETSSATAEQTMARYLAIVQARPRDLRYEVEMKELQKLFRHRARDLDAPGTPKRYRVSLATQEERMAATAFIVLTKGYSPEGLGFYDAMTTLREIFTGEAALQDPNLVHEAARTYVQSLSPRMLEKYPDWWINEFHTFRENAEQMRQQIVNKTSPWAQNNPNWHPPLGGPSDLMVLEAFAQVLRPLPTTHPALSDGMRLLGFLAKRRNDVDPMNSNFVMNLVNSIRQEKIAALPQPFMAKGWGVDPQTGRPLYVDKMIDPKLYRVQEVQGPEGTQWEIEGPDLKMRIPKATRSSG